MVLPVLMKGDLKTQPLFRLIWGLAYEKLKRAEEVFFVGYSMPTTDMAARFLFMETLSETANVFVVNFANQKNERESIKSVYREVIPRLQDKDFNFDGASEWCKEFAN
jgi:hypothetical protein